MTDSWLSTKLEKPAHRNADKNLHRGVTDVNSSAISREISFLEKLVHKALPYLHTHHPLG